MREDAEDILQDVWAQFSAVIDSQPIEQASAWLFTVARNKITDKHRKIQPESLDVVSQETREGEVFLKDLLLSPVGDPEREHLRNAFWEQLFTALEELPEPQRQVFTWHELDDLSFEEIAERTGEKINTLISRKRYAVLHLRERLQIIYNEIIHHHRKLFLVADVGFENKYFHNIMHFGFLFQMRVELVVVVVAHTSCYHTSRRNGCAIPA